MVEASDDPFEGLVGRTLRGKYRIERGLGSGGMGIVVLAHHLKLDQPVAIKLLRRTARGKANIIARFAREARAAARLRSDHVVRILDVDEDDDGSPFFVMERLHGIDLEALVKRDGKLGVGRAVDLILQACEALAEAHALGMVHRDLKPANLFVVRARDGSELVKLLDFGISKTEEQSGVDEASLTSPAAIMGSPLYMSPEQIRSSKTVDHRADIWALGIVLYQLLTGALPFHASNVTGVAATIAADPPRPIAELRSDLPSELVRAIERCLEKDPKARFASVLDLARVLAPLATDDAVDARKRVRAIEIAAELSDPALRTTVGEDAPKEASTEKADARRTATITDVAKTTAGASASAQSVRPPAATTDRAIAAPKSSLRRWALRAGFPVALTSIAIFVATRRSPPVVVPVTAIQPEAATPIASPPLPSMTETTAPSLRVDPSVPDAAPTAKNTTSAIPRVPPSPATRTSAPPSSTIVAPAVSSGRSPLDIDLK